MNEQKMTGDPRIDYKWFSRKHETREAHEIAQQRCQKHQEDKALLLEVNQAARGQRMPQLQLAVLDKRLGIGKGAVKERARLLKQIELRKASVAAVVEDRAKLRWIEPKVS